MTKYTNLSDIAVGQRLPKHNFLIYCKKLVANIEYALFCKRMNCKHDNAVFFNKENER